MRFSFSTIVLIVGLAFTGIASAKETGLNFEAVRSQQAEIRSGVIAKIGRYSALADSTRHELLSRQTRLLSAIEGKRAVDDLTQQERTEVFNDLEWIEAAINNTHDERLVCEYVKTIGSNRKQRVCRTPAQMQEERERAREALDRSDAQMRRGS